MEREAIPSSIRFLCILTHSSPHLFLHFFGWEGSPTNIDYSKKWHPYSNLYYYWAGSLDFSFFFWIPLKKDCPGTAQWKWPGLFHRLHHLLPGLHTRLHRGTQGPIDRTPLWLDLWLGIPQERNKNGGRGCGSKIGTQNGTW